MLRVGNAPCSWGVLEFGLGGQAAGYGRVLDEMSAAGYAGTELGDWGFMPTDPAGLQGELRTRGLAMIGAFVPVRFRDPAAHAAGEEAALRTARLLAALPGDAPFIILADENGTDPFRTQHAGRIPAQDGLRDGEWRVFADGVQRVALAVRRETGLRTVFHHHCGGFVETPRETQTLLSLTDPALVGLCFDTGHWRFGGGEPASDLPGLGSRVWHVHLKDCDPLVASLSREQGWGYLESVRRGVFCELGRGDIGFGAVVAQLGRSGYDGWVVVEQDVLPGMGTPAESAGRSRGYLQGLGL